MYECLQVVCERTHIIIVTLASGMPNTFVHSHSSSILLLSPPASTLVNINRHLLDI